jgi:Fic family protein
VRLEDAWEAWLVFFLQGVLETATQAVETSKRILALIDADRCTLEGASRASAALRAHQYLQRKLFASTSQLAMALNVSQPTALAALEKLEGLGITVETTARSRDRIWVYQRYLDLLEVGLGGTMNGRDQP